MKEVFEKFRLEPYEIFSTKEENSIVIFPEVPFWIAVSRQGLVALQEMKNTGSIECVAEKVLGRTDTVSYTHLSQPEKSAVSGVVCLMEAGIFYGIRLFV